MSHKTLITSTKQNVLLRRRKEEEQRKPTTPEAFPNQLALLWVMTHLLKRPRISARTACKTFAGTGLYDGTNTRAFPHGNGLCNLPSVHLISILQPCAVSTLKRIVTC